MYHGLRWIRITLGGLLGLVLLAFAVIYILSERILGERHPILAVSLAVPSDPASIAEGRRMAIVRGCSGDCHGKEVGGAVMFDRPAIAAYLHTVSDAAG